MIRQICVATMLAWCTLSALPASAGTLVDTGVPTRSDFYVDVGFFSNYTTFENRAAAKFSLQSQSTITGIEAYLKVYNTGAFGFEIVSAGGGTPDTGAVLFDAAPVLENNPVGGWAGLNGLNLSLAAGDYWLVLRGVPNSPTFVLLPLNPPNPLTNAYWFSASQSWIVISPNSQYRDNFGVRIFGAAGAVPEPASWSLMITGFALTGAALRRRRLQTA